jgi:hypothetical protein
VDPQAHRTLGLEGFLVVVRKGQLRKDGLMPNDVDFMVPMLWQVCGQVVIAVGWRSFNRGISRARPILEL